MRGVVGRNLQPYSVQRGERDNAHSNMDACGCKYGSFHVKDVRYECVCVLSVRLTSARDGPTKLKTE
eukprot:scaffold649_cov347-Pavlova_lutheri.AAC.78